MASESARPRRSHASISARSALLIRGGKAGVSIEPLQTVAWDEAHSSTPTPNACLPSGKSERVWPTGYVRELASETTSALLPR